MATSKCGKCESTRFELTSTVNKIEGAKYAYSFIQCRACGAVVGVVDFHHVPTLLEEIAAKLGFKLFK